MPGTSRSRLVRIDNDHFSKYLHGDGIDIGCGSDPLIIPEGTVRPWDKKDGNGAVLHGVPDESFDFVYSSHCLEHIHGVTSALVNWTRVLRPGGFLFVVVPDYQLYEKLCWPSKYNGDHKHTFSISFTRQKIGRENHWNVTRDLIPLVRGMGHKIMDFRLEDDGFDYDDGMTDQTLGDHALSQIRVIFQKK